MKCLCCGKRSISGSHITIIMVIIVYSKEYKGRQANFMGVCVCVCVENVCTSIPF